MRRWAITGTSRGLGCALAANVLAKEEHAICLSRSGTAKVGHPRRTDLSVDLLCPQSIEQVAAKFPVGQIDVLVHNAAIRGDVGGLLGFGAKDFLEVMQVNVVAPFLLTRVLLPRLAPNATVAFISSRSGSCAEGSDPDGDYAYCMSKAALNRAMVKLSDDYPFRVLAVHPGWIKTDMGGATAPTSTENSAEAIYRLLTEEPLPKTGWFGDANGVPIAW